ncbi:AraC family transcriptional regulator [Paenibacillus cellulosilyticus]|nr:AraC family transcriptional regulator [Paenibacillus cellulosilyticus]
MNRVREDYPRMVQTTIDYAEEHLDEELSLSRLAQVAGFSDFHFHRVFQTMAGETVMDYVRRRRLAVSAYRVAYSDERLLDIALHCGFQNHETFTRAFKRMFGRTPGEYRKLGIKPPPYAKLNVLQQHNNPFVGGIQLEYRIITKPAFKVIGYETTTTSCNGDNMREIPAFWQDYIKRGLSQQIPNRISTEMAELGICYNFNMETSQFNYLIGMEVGTFDGMLEGQVAREFGEADYAVFTTPLVEPALFTHSIQSTWQRIYTEWFPQSGYEHAGKPEFELYDERSNPARPEIQMDIYIPIKRK